MRVFITGAAGFIGFHLARRLLTEGHEVAGYDNLNAYYDPQLKRDRLAILKEFPAFSITEADLADSKALSTACHVFAPDHVVNLAAQAGVRYSLDAPQDYVKGNLVGFANLLECCRQRVPKHLIYASTSSIYGASRQMPYAEGNVCDHQLNLYAASKKANEAMAHAYSHLFGIPATGLRFFTVYGEWGRPDMAFFKFANAIMSGKPIDVYNNGNMSRDFTYVGDIVEGLMQVVAVPPEADAEWDASKPSPGASGVAPHRVFNIGNGNPVSLMRYIEVLEECLGRKAKYNFMPMQSGDVQDTCADVSKLATVTGYTPKTSVEEGLKAFADWYLSYYGK